MSGSSRVQVSPFRRIWAAYLARWISQVTADIPRPHDAPRGHAPGHDSDRILIFGAGPACGWGVSTHELALPGAVARAVSVRTRRGCDVDVTADSTMTVADAPDYLTDRRLSRYDAVVVVLGVNDALGLTAPSVWRENLRHLLTLLLDGCPAGTEIVVAGIHPIRSIRSFDSWRANPAQRLARQLNAETIRMCAEDPRTVFVDMPAPTPDTARHRTARMYHQWAQVLARAVVPYLSTELRLDSARAVPAARAGGAAEAIRQRAVDELTTPDAKTRASLQHIVSLAKQAFGAKAAVITVLDRDRQWELAGTEETLTEIPRSESFCDFAIQGDGPMVVRDARLDPRFRDNPQVTGSEQLRFYAGFPIETPSGERLGALCVLDSEARPQTDELDVDLLRELAYMVQHELWPYVADRA